MDIKQDLIQGQIRVAIVMTISLSRRRRNNYAPFNPNASRNPVKRTLSFLGSTVAAAASSTAVEGKSIAATSHKFEQLLGGGGGGQNRYGFDMPFPMPS